MDEPADRLFYYFTGYLKSLFLDSRSRALTNGINSQIMILSPTSNINYNFSHIRISIAI